MVPSFFRLQTNTEPTPMAAVSVTKIWVVLALLCVVLLAAALLWG